MSNIHDIPTRELDPLAGDARSVGGLVEKLGEDPAVAAVFLADGRDGRVGLDQGDAEGRGGRAHVLYIAPSSREGRLEI